MIEQQPGSVPFPGAPVPDSMDPRYQALADSLRGVMGQNPAIIKEENTEPSADGNMISGIEERTAAALHAITRALYGDGADYHGGFGRIEESFPVAAGVDDSPRSELEVALRMIGIPVDSFKARKALHETVESLIDDQGLVSRKDRERLQGEIARIVRRMTPKS
jgi:hypothetical protein